MASPWKFLGRLWPARGKQRRDHELVDITPKVLAIAAPMDTSADDHVTIPPVGRQPPRDAPPDIVSIEPPPEQLGPSAAGPATRSDAVSADAGSSVLAEAADIVPTSGRAAKPELTAKVSRSSPGGKVEPAAPSPQITSTMRSAADEALALDREILELRRQLAVKLQQQNDQLKKMLKRFDR